VRCVRFQFGGAVGETGGVDRSQQLGRDRRRRHLWRARILSGAAA
jgi:hypothetical protein